MRQAQILTDLPDSEVIKGLRRIISELALRRINVSDIETKKERAGNTWMAFRERSFRI